jgi:hypothetical protein
MFTSVTYSKKNDFINLDPLINLKLLFFFNSVSCFYDHQNYLTSKFSIAKILTVIIDLFNDIE